MLPLLRHSLPLVPLGIFKPVVATGLIPHLYQTVRGRTLVSTFSICNLVKFEDYPRYGPFDRCVKETKQDHFRKLLSCGNVPNTVTRGLQSERWLFSSSKLFKEVIVTPAFLTLNPVHLPRKKRALRLVSSI
jgi:hypothetical protein